MTTGFDIGGVSGRPIRGSDNAYGFQAGLVTTDGIRESTWQDALELAGLYIQYSTDGSTWSDTSSASDTHFRLASGTEKPSDSSSRWSAGIELGGDQPDITGLVDDVTFVDPTVTVTYQDGTTSTFDLPAGGGLSTVNTEDPVEGDGSTATPVTLTDTAKHSLSQIPALEERTQDLAIEDTYVWADTTDGVISLRSDAPPAPWLQTTIWGATYSYSSQDAGADNTYIVLRIGNSEEVNQFRVGVTKGSNTFYYNGAAFKRIHKSETTHKYYGHPNSNLQSGDELQVQKGTVTGEVTEYRGHVGGASFTAPDGNGNLAATVDTIDELVSAVDDLTTGGGDVTAERTSIYLDAADVAQNTIHSGSFDEAIVAGYTLEFSFSNGGASGTPRAYVQMTSDEFLGLTVQAAAPTTAAQAQGFNVRQIDVTGINTNALDTVYIWRGATDSDFYYDVWRGGNFRLQVYQVRCGRSPLDGRVETGRMAPTAPTEWMGQMERTARLAPWTPLTEGRLNSVDGLVAKTADLSIEAVTHSWANVAVLANGGFIAHNDDTDHCLRRRH